MVEALRRIAVVGNSHAVTLIQGCPEVAGTLRPDETLTFIAQTDQDTFADLHRWYLRADAHRIERLQWHGEMADVLTETRPTHVFVLWRGNQLSLRSIVLDGPDYDVVLPNDPDPPTDPDVTLIPCSVFAAIVRKSLLDDQRLERVVAVTGHIGAKLWMLGPPPLLPESAVRDRLKAQPQFRAKLAEFGTSVDLLRLSPDRVRNRLRSLLVEEYRRFASGRDAGFIAPPEETCDAAGMLRRDFWGTDVTHGNAAYGAAYVRKILGTVDAISTGSFATG